MYVHIVILSTNFFIPFGGRALVHHVIPTTKQVNKMDAANGLIDRNSQCERSIVLIRSNATGTKLNLSRSRTPEPTCT